MEVLEWVKCSQGQEKKGLVLVSGKEQVKETATVRFQVLRNENYDNQCQHLFFSLNTFVVSLRKQVEGPVIWRRSLTFGDKAQSFLLVWLERTNSQSCLQFYHSPNQFYHYPAVNAHSWLKNVALSCSFYCPGEPHRKESWLSPLRLPSNVNQTVVGRETWEIFFQRALSLCKLVSSL